MSRRCRAGRSPFRSGVRAYSAETLKGTPGNPERKVVAAAPSSQSAQARRGVADTSCDGASQLRQSFRVSPSVGKAHALRGGTVFIALHLQVAFSQAAEALPTKVGNYLPRHLRLLIGLF